MQPDIFWMEQKTFECDEKDKIVLSDECSESPIYEQGEFRPVYVKGYKAQGKIHFSVQVNDF